MEERISKLKNRNLEIIQVEEKRFFFQMKKFCENNLSPSGKANIRLMSIPQIEEREKGAVSLF